MLCPKDHLCFTMMGSLLSSPPFPIHRALLSFPFCLGLAQSCSQVVLPRLFEFHFRNCGRTRVPRCHWGIVWNGYKSRWWFQIVFIFIPIWGRCPFWLIFFRWVETTNQKMDYIFFWWCHFLWSFQFFDVCVFYFTFYVSKYLWHWTKNIFDKMIPRKKKKKTFESTISHPKSCLLSGIESDCFQKENHW